MAGDVLSQAELETLLSTMEGVAPTASEPAQLGPLGGSSAGSPGQGVKRREKILPYDFKRPERVGKEQMRALETLHEGFGRNFGARLSTMLRSILEVKLTSVCQLTYS